MATDHDWKDKYREVLGQLAAEEARWSKAQNVLRLLVGRLCLAAQGRDSRLDQELTRVGDIVRGQIDVDALDVLIAPLSAAVAALDTVPANPESPEDVFGATAVLDRLALLPELKPVVGELRSRRHDTLDIHELAGLLERITGFATEQRSQVQKEKLELENIVQQLASRLEEISQHITSELADRSAGQEDAEQLNLQVNAEVKELRTSAEQAADLTMLRQNLSTRLDAIGNHISDFRQREETRVRTYRDRVQRMRTRIAVLERESRTLHETLREEQRLAMIDALTGIPNRAAYDDRIEEEHKRWKRFGRPVCILAWDIDRFKAINDAYGHKAGDKVLRVIGQHLARHVRDTDFVARYGGEEFVMLLVGTDAEGARTVAEKIRQEISQLGFHFHDTPVAITASCGITTFTGDDAPGQAFDRADKALYQAKEAGRNCCVIG